ncbi:DUF3253 domain-containing protein [Sagittula salina]|uniref:DUF3253 domain-containing protein n=1 Tax=Sagittula salina TaxID=2820268 RepID=A0A940MM19_9RHOB|nr:DUF3253 domain-containing protein [Sagittula salina]
MGAPDDDRIAAILMDLARARAPRSICPSEAARALSPDWQPLMPRVRHVAATLPLIATQKWRTVDPLTARGRSG